MRKVWEILRRRTTVRRWHLEILDLPRQFFPVNLFGLSTGCPSVEWKIKKTPTEAAAVLAAYDVSAIYAAAVTVADI